MNYSVQGGALATALGLTLALGLPAYSQTMAEAFTAIGAELCEDSDLLCVSVEVPLNHFDPVVGETIQITYALSPAAEESLGLMVYVVGGPGGTAVVDADYYLSDIAQDVLDAYDIMFFDLRGVGTEHGISCPTALDALFRADGMHFDPGSKDVRDGIVTAVDTYIADCTAEMAYPEVLPHVGTDQAVRDLEILRQAIGAPELWLYGHSYGTEFVQEYAATFPDAVAGVILDAVVDPELTLTAFQESTLTGSEALLERMFAFCDADAECSADMGMPTAQAYEALQTLLSDGAIMVDYPLAEGGTEPRELDLAFLQVSTFNNLYSPGGRSWFLRVLAAASRGDLIPLLRDSYYESSIDIESNEPLLDEDEGFYGAAYYAIVCEDWTEGQDPDAEMARVLHATEMMAPELPRFLDTYFQELSICARMALPASEPRPPFVGGDYPTLVLNSSTDPITPIDQAVAVYERSENAALIVLEGGPHVVWRMDYPCIESAVVRLLVDGEMPDAPIQVCQTDFVPSYTPLSLPTEPLDPLWLARSVLLEMDMDLAFLGYAMDYDAASGCTRGGTLEAVETDAGAQLTFSDCSYWDGISVSGAGTMTGEDYEIERVNLTLTVTSNGMEMGQIDYNQDWLTGTDWIAGTWNGQTITTTWQ
jgi:pimeloyl-ACP methyl ester carboxylesterase